MSEPRAYVRLTEPAIEDLRTLSRRDPQVVRWALKKMLLLERDPQAGQPLLGELIGWRKITVGDRGWRIVWRVSSNDNGSITITVSEVWAVGARSEGEVYAEMVRRVASLGDAPDTQALKSVIETLGRHAQRTEIRAAAEPTPDPVPEWLVERLVHTAGVPETLVRAMTGADAMSRWEQFLQTGQ